MSQIEEKPIFIENPPKANIGDLILYEEQIYFIENVFRHSFTDKEKITAEAHVRNIRQRNNNNDATANLYHYSYVPAGLNIEIGPMSSIIGIEEINNYLKQTEGLLEYYKNKLSEIKEIVE
jgi:hypothetical protein